jgi:hypothetical protein
MVTITVQIVGIHKLMVVALVRAKVTEELERENTGSRVVEQRVIAGSYAI